MHFSLGQFAQEQAIAIEVNGITYSVMMITPCHLSEFVYGFLFSESIILNPLDVYDIEIENSAFGNDNFLIQTKNIKVTLSNRALHRAKLKIRAVKGNAACGICGSAALEDVFASLQNIRVNNTNNEFPLAIDSLHGIREDISQAQSLSNASGAMHAAALLKSDATIECIFEDIGRHNALDKLIGHIMQQNKDVDAMAIVITSRCGSELVQKAAKMGVNTLISFASPTTLAYQLAQHANLRLIHVPKRDAPIEYLPPAKLAI
jgi:FdhD protein